MLPPGTTRSSVTSGAILEEDGGAGICSEAAEVLFPDYVAPGGANLAFAKARSGIGDRGHKHHGGRGSKGRGGRAFRGQEDQRKESTVTLRAGGAGGKAGTRSPSSIV